MKLSERKRCRVSVLGQRLNGEKPSKYFTSLESRNYINKQIPQVVRMMDKLYLTSLKYWMKQNDFMRIYTRKGKLLNQRFLLQNLKK